MFKREIWEQIVPESGILNFSISNEKIHVVCVILLWKNISVNKFCAILHALFIDGSNLLWKKLQFTFIQLNLIIFVSSLNLYCTT
jgi:hypothetical protein